MEAAAIFPSPLLTQTLKTNGTHHHFTWKQMAPTTILLIKKVPAPSDYCALCDQPDGDLYFWFIFDF